MLWMSHHQLRQILLYQIDLAAQGTALTNLERRIGDQEIVLIGRGCAGSVSYSLINQHIRRVFTLSGSGQLPTGRNLESLARADHETL